MEKLSVMEKVPLPDNLYLHQAYQINFHLEKLSRMDAEYFQTPSFSPFKNSNCFFELLFYNPLFERNQQNCVLSELNGSITKLSNPNLDKNLTFQLHLEVCYVPKNKQNLPFNPFYYTYRSHVLENVYSMPKISKLYLKTCCAEIPLADARDTLVMKCMMVFYGQFSAPSQCLEIGNYSSYLVTSEKVFDEFTYENKSCDFEVKVAGSVFPVHKSVLTKHSKVWSDKLNLICFKQSYRMDCYKPEIVKSFLEYLYSEKLQSNSWENLKEIYYIAEEFKVKSLQEKCIEQITMCFINMHHIYEILKFAYDHNLEELKTQALNFAAMNMEKLKANKQEYTSLMHHNFEIILALKTFRTGC